MSHACDGQRRVECPGQTFSPLPVPRNVSWDVIVILVVMSLVPPMLFLGWLRRTEIHGREPWNDVFGRFAFGASFGIVLGLVLSLVFGVSLSGYTDGFGLDPVLVGAVIVAPLAEEFAKALGLARVRPRLKELEDGIVYGAALGLGFAATENLVYGLNALSDGGTNLAYTTVILRVFSSMLVHAGASAIIGFGYGVVAMRGGVWLQLFPQYLAAVALHAAYNLVAFRNDLLGLAASLVIGIAVAARLRSRIQELDALPHEAARRALAHERR